MTRSYQIAVSIGSLVLGLTLITLIWQLNSKLQMSIIGAFASVVLLMRATMVAKGWASVSIGFFDGPRYTRIGMVTYFVLGVLSMIFAVCNLLL